MNFAATDNDHAASTPSGHDDAYAALIGLARLSRLNLLYYRSDQAGAGGRMLLQAARRRRGNEIALLFDEWEDAPLAMLQQRLDAAVHAADHGAAPYFGDLPGALAHWQHEQGLRFFLILHAFERHLRRNAELADVAEFDRALIRLASDPMLELHILLCIDEADAPALDRLRPFLADLGQEYLRLPELPGAPPRPQENAPQIAAGAPAPAVRASEALDDVPKASDAPAREPHQDRQAQAPPPRRAVHAASLARTHAGDEPVLPILPTAPLPPSEQDADALAASSPVDTDHPDVAPGVHAPPDGLDSEAEGKAGTLRRRRDFSSLLETLNAAPLASALSAAPAAPDEAGAPAAFAGAAQSARPAGQLPARVYPWARNHVRQSRLRTLRLFAQGMLGSTVICLVLLAVAALSWELPQLRGAVGAAASQPDRPTQR